MPFSQLLTSQGIRTRVNWEKGLGVRSSVGVPTPRLSEAATITEPATSLALSGKDVAGLIF
jgi:hypothetical protein